MLKYGDLSARDAPSSAHGRGLEDAVAAELGRRADAEASELERTAQLVRAEWEVRAARGRAARRRAFVACSRPCYRDLAHGLCRGAPLRARLP